MERADEYGTSGRVDNLWRPCLGATLVLLAISTLTQLLASPSSHSAQPLLSLTLTLPLLLFSSGVRVYDTFRKSSETQSTFFEFIAWVSGLLLFGVILRVLPGTEAFGRELLVVAGLSLGSILFVWLPVSWLAITSLLIFAAAMIKAAVATETVTYSYAYLLPIILSAFIARRDHGELTLYPQAFVWGIGALLMSVVTPVSGAQLSPSFVALGSAVGLALLGTLRLVEVHPILERVGEAPFRLVFVPTTTLILIIGALEESTVQLTFHWPMAVLLSISILGLWIKLLLPYLEPISTNNDS